MKLAQLLAQLFAGAALALTASAHAQSSTAPMAAEGEIRKVDKAQAKVTLRHGPIENLGMPGMTMVFKVSDPKMLDTVKVGDKVKFAADKLNGVLTVTAIEAAR